ncbi:MAG: flagellar export protein FliJ [Candidatus Nitricoxidivorans perseverans]|uniref:Flagellar FliJ protein n=1 Tax=Candidatus Nitricoxidivorans perseverans TaxID=2975601 RepID=A0AA49FN18_9PROT|nr:MAG: flagellar export protein FliJ [Candidatus Nitricoxidivorans perseverans]
MTKKFPLQSILDLSNLRLDEAARRLGELIASEQDALSRLELLGQYREEYHARFLAAARDGLGPDQWRNFHLFLERLDVAIAQAGEMATQSRQHTAAGQQEWLSKRGRVKAFDTLAQRHKTRVDYGESRQEQKDIDEHSARRHSTKEE